VQNAARKRLGPRQKTQKSRQRKRHPAAGAFLAHDKIGAGARRVDLAGIVFPQENDARHDFRDPQMNSDFTQDL
jgi:hypothetical protein